MSGEYFQKAVLEDGRAALVEFWAPWCTYCRRLGPVMEKVAEEYGPQLLIGQINTDEEPELAREYGIDAIPTLLFFQEGELRGTITAPESKAVIDAFLSAQTV